MSAIQRITLVMAGLLLMMWPVVDSWSGILILKEKELFMDEFARADTGLANTASRMWEVKNVSSKEKNNIGPVRIKFRPNQVEKNLKSRLELNTCFLSPHRQHREEFTHNDMEYLRLNLARQFYKHGISGESDPFLAKEMMEQMMRHFKIKDLQLKTPSRLQTMCGAANEPLEAIHEFKYELIISNATTISNHHNLIITQFHGSPNPNMMNHVFAHKCISYVSDEDMDLLCDYASRICKDGKVLDVNGTDTGLRYQQGGKPPLVFRIKHGMFIVHARSDERLFKDKRRCRGHAPCKYKEDEVVKLWEAPIESFTNKRLHIKWKIVWSSYGAEEVGTDMYDPGIIRSKAWIRMFINHEKVIDKYVECGRNDEGRVPYLKMGVYNPNGHPHNISLTIKNYNHTYEKFEDITDKKVLRKIKSLEIIHPKSHEGIPHRLVSFNRTNYLNRTANIIQFVNPNTDDICSLRTMKTIDGFDRAFIDSVDTGSFKPLFTALANSLSASLASFFGLKS